MANCAQNQANQDDDAGGSGNGPNSNNDESHHRSNSGAGSGNGPLDPRSVEGFLNGQVAAAAAAAAAAGLNPRTSQAALQHQIAAAAARGIQVSRQRFNVLVFDRIQVGFCDVIVGAAGKPRNGSSVFDAFAKTVLSNRTEQQVNIKCLHFLDLLIIRVGIRNTQNYSI